MNDPSIGYNRITNSCGRRLTAEIARQMDLRDDFETLENKHGVRLGSQERIAINRAREEAWFSKSDPECSKLPFFTGML